VTAEHRCSQTIQLFGYVPSNTGEAATQSSNAELGVLLGFTVVPGLVVGLALLFLRTYNLGQQTPLELSASPVA